MLVEELANLSGPSGSEDNVRDFNRAHAIADEIYTDNMGNLICHKKGSGKRVMVCAHMDEVALIIYLSTFLLENIRDALDKDSQIFVFRIYLNLSHSYS